MKPGVKQDGASSVTVSEIWEGREQHDKWFDENVKANVQGEIKQEVIELRNIVEA
jgi:hypothetical protein